MYCAKDVKETIRVNDAEESSVAGSLMGRKKKKKKKNITSSYRIILRKIIVR